MATRARRAIARAVAGGVVVAVIAAGKAAVDLGGVEHPVHVVMAALRGARFHGIGDGVLQRSANDCGPAALTHCLRRLGRAAPYPDPASRIRLGPRGCSFAELAEEASRRGWSVVVRRLAPAELAAVTPPAILYLRCGHFVVYEGRTEAGRYVCHDPALGRVSWELPGLAARWGGEILYAPVGRSRPE